MPGGIARRFIEVSSSMRYRWHNDGRFTISGASKRTDESYHRAFVARNASATNLRGFTGVISRSIVKKRAPRKRAVSAEFRAEFPSDETRACQPSPGSSSVDSSRAKTPLVPSFDALMRRTGITKRFMRNSVHHLEARAIFYGEPNGPRRRSFGPLGRAMNRWSHSADKTRCVIGTLDSVIFRGDD